MVNRQNWKSRVAGGLLLLLAMPASARSQSVVQAEDAALFSAYVRQEHTGYTGTGYVKPDSKTGAYMEFVFRRETAATDTVLVRYANGGSSRNFAVQLNDVSVGSFSFPSTLSWTTWSTRVIVVGLQAGINRLRFTTTTNTTTYPVVDQITVKGQPAVTMFGLKLTKSGNGSVSALPSAAYHDAGSTVELTASPSGSGFFKRWMGANDSPANPYTLVMNGHKTVVGVFLDTTGVSGFIPEPSPRAFASVNALGTNGTTGGLGGDEVTVTTGDDLWNLMLLRADANRTVNFSPLTVYVVGTLTPGPVIGSSSMLSVKDAYDISIIGVGQDATISGFGLNIVRSINIIVRGIRFTNATDDGISIDASDDEALGHHIWVDHCTFEPPGHDGALDITHTAAYVTASWNHFKGWDKNSLVGHSNSNTSDVNMKISYHHNYFDATSQRNPRVRFGKVHVFNNYYRNNSLYGVSSNMEADVLVEGNYFINVPIPTETSRDGSPPGDLVQRYNVFVNCGTPGTRGTAFEADQYYAYMLDSASTIPQLVSKYAGSGVYDFSYHASTAVYTLSVSATNGTVTRNPDLPTYPHGTNVELTATPSSGYFFVNWTGDVPPSQATHNPLVITMDANKSLTAHFTDQLYMLSVSAVNGSVVRNPDLPSYPAGSSVQLTATPSAGYFFVNWTGDVPAGQEADNPLTVLMDGNKSLSANFSNQTFTLNTNAVNGSIVRNPNQAAYDSGATVQLTAVPDTGYHFVGWSGDASGTTNPITIVMNANKSVTAAFAINHYTLTVNAANGIVTKSPDQPTYPHGTTVSLTATPNSGYLFSGWSGDASGTANPVNVLMTTNRSVTANFTSMGMIATSNGTGGGAWTAPGTWEGGVVPTSSHHVMIAGSDSVFVTSAVSCSSLTVQSGARLSTTATITVSGLFALEEGAFYYHGASGTFALPGATRFVDDASTVVYNSTAGATSIAGGAFGNLVIMRGSSNTNAIGVLTINGDLTLNNTSGSAGLRGTSGATSRTNIVRGNVYILGGTLSCIDNGSGSAVGVWDIGGNVHVLGSTNARLSPFSSGGASTVTGVFNIGGDLVVAGGRLQYATNNSTSGLGIINLAGNLEVQSGSSITDNSSTGPFAFNFVGSDTQLVRLGMNFSMATNIYDTVKSGSTVVFDTTSFSWGSTAGTSGMFVVNGLLALKGNAAIAGAGGFQLNPAGTLVIGSPDGIASSAMAGNIRVSGSRTFSTEAHYVYAGIEPQVTGSGLPSTAEVLTVSNPASVALTSSTVVTDALRVEEGYLDLNGNAVVLGPAAVLSEAPGHTVRGASGSISTVRTLVAPSVTTDIAGLGVRIGSSADLGVTTIVRTHASHAAIGGINRSFDITPSTNTGLNATFVFRYDESELNTIPEQELGLFKSTDNGVSWMAFGGTVDGPANTITVGGVDDFSLWTAAEDTSGGVFTVNVPLMQGWNMVSNPVATASDSVRQMFPTSVLDYAFSFAGGVGYVQEHRLLNGIGYWAKFPAATTSVVQGAPLHGDTLSVGAGWNMIGSISFAVDTSNVAWVPQGNRASLYFGYDGGYAGSETIEPGRAYWVKATQPGAIILSSGSTLGRVVAPASPLDHFSSITFADATGAAQTLYVGQAKDGFEAGFFEMPPVGPDGVFDVRFESQRMVEVYTGGRSALFPLRLSSAVSPVTITWDVRSSEGVLVLVTATNDRHALGGKGRMTLAGPPYQRMTVGVEQSEEPRGFMLAQNHPNPFNPFTEIMFSVGTQGRATLDVFNMLGQHLSTLFDNDVEPGQFYRVSFDGTGVASGVYFYRLQSGNTVAVKRLMVLK